MNQSQITTIHRQLNARSEAILNATHPVEKTPSATEILSGVLVTGKKLKLRSYDAIRKTALSKIVSGTYHSERKFSLEEIFEPNDAVKRADEVVRNVERARVKLNGKLLTVISRIVTELKLGRYDGEPSAALEVFETRAADIVAAI